MIHVLLAATAFVVGFCVVLLAQERWCWPFPALVALAMATSAVTTALLDPIL